MIQCMTDSCFMLLKIISFLPILLCSPEYIIYVVSNIFIGKCQRLNGRYDPWGLKGGFPLLTIRIHSVQKSQKEAFFGSKATRECQCWSVSGRARIRYFFHSNEFFNFFKLTFFGNSQED